MQRLKPKLLSLIIPVYRQEKTIADNIRSILKEFRLFPFPYELIVVTDGDTDRSYQEASRVKSDHLRVYGYAHNRGKGYAVRFGIAKSRGDVVGFMDAGGDISEESLSMLFEHFRWYNADVIIGSKRHPASKVKYPLYRKIISWCGQLVIRLLFGLNIRDTQVGMKLYRRVVLEDVLPRLVVKKFAFDVEILVVAYHLGYRRIFEAPIELDFSGASSITSKNFWRIIGKTLIDTLAIFYRLKILHYYDTMNKSNWRFEPELTFLGPKK